LKADFFFNYFFKKPGTENEFEFTTKVATEIESWLMWFNVSRLVAFAKPTNSVLSAKIIVLREKWE